MQCHARERTRTIFAYTTFGFNLIGCQSRMRKYSNIHNVPMKITGRNTSKRPTNSHIVSRTMLNGKFFTKKFKEQKKLFSSHMTTCGLLIRPIWTISCTFLCSKSEVAVARMNTFQWNHSTTMANHSCPGHSDVWRFCNSDFIFVMSTCRFFITPGRGQGPLLSLCKA